LLNKELSLYRNLIQKLQVKGVELYFSYYSYMYVILMDLCQEIQIMYDGD